MAEIATEADIATLYQKYLGRAGTPAEYQAWIPAGFEYADKTLASSPEALAYAAAIAQATTNTQATTTTSSTPATGLFDHLKNVANSLFDEISTATGLDKKFVVIGAVAIGGWVLMSGFQQGGSRKR